MIFSSVELNFVQSLLYAMVGYCECDQILWLKNRRLMDLGKNGSLAAQ